jgi:hypothetical protein
MEFSCEVADVYEVIMDVSSFDESALAEREEVFDERSEVQRKHLSYDLHEVVDKDYEHVVNDRLSPIFFGVEDYVSFVEEVEVQASRVVKGVNCLHNIVPYQRSANLEEASRKAVGNQGLVLWHEANCSPHLVVTEGAVEGC